MGIKRCPYCRALISDKDQYCKNCGTQLLFPEDEEIEEEIPGDKIIKDDREREDEEKLSQEEPEGVEEETGEGLETEGYGDLAGKENTEEVILVEEADYRKREETVKTSKVFSDEVEAEGFLAAEEKEKLPFPESRTPKATGKEKFSPKPTEEFLLEKIKEEILSETGLAPEERGESGPGVVTRIVEELRREEEQKEVKEGEPESRPGLVTRMVEELGVEEKRASAESYEVEAGEEEESRPLIFESAELEKIGATTELGRREVEDFFKVLEEKEKEHVRDKLKTSGKGQEEIGEVPSWIKEVKTASTELLKGSAGTGEERELEKAETETDELWLEEEPSSEPTMGFPEKLTRSGLEPYEKEEETTGEMDIKEEIEEETEDETEEIFIGTPKRGTAGPSISGRSMAVAEGRRLPPLEFKNFVKAKIFDLLFLFMFWLASIWIAARSMETTIFKLLGMASSGLLLYLLILTFFYFFLFYFFIGETLGDRLFRENEEEESP